VLTEEEPQRTVATPPSGAGAQAFVRKYVWWIVAIGLLAASAGIVPWAHSRPGYDPYGWMVWGYQTLHGSLNLGGAPSWKPMPLLFTTPFALFGHFQLWMWMTVAVWISLGGCIFAGRIAFRVVDQDGANRWPAVAAAVFAGVMPLVIFDSTHYSYIHYILSSQSDPPLVTFVLAAIDLHMIGRRRWAIVALTMASLGRPEAWPAEFLYALWLLRESRTENLGMPLRDDPMFRFLLGNLAVILFMWFGIPEITNHKPLLAGDLAANSPRMLHSNKIVGTLSRFKDLNQWPVWLCAGIGSAWAAFRLRRKDPDPRGHNRLIVILFGLIALWVVVEIIFSLKGLPGVPRYMFEPGVVSIVIAAIGFGWVLSEIPRFFKAPWALGVVLAAGVTAGIVPGAVARLRTEHKELQGEKARTAEIGRLAGFVHILGGLHGIRACGKPVINVEYVSVFAWLTHLNTGSVGYRPNVELNQKYPTVLLTPLPNGWAAYPWHTKAANLASCDAHMKVLYIFTGHHPNGVTVPNKVPPTVTPLKPKKHKKA
jgi:hypothetical protein